MALALQGAHLGHHQLSDQPMSADNIARGLALSQSVWDNKAATRGVAGRRYGRTGFRVVQGRVANTVNAEGTYEMAFEVPAAFDEIAPIFAFGSTGNGLVIGNGAAGAGQAWNARALRNWSEAENNDPEGSVAGGGSIRRTTGPASFAVVAAASARRNYVKQVPVLLRSPARNDGLPGAIVVFRTKVPAGALMMFGDGVQSFTNWSNKADGHAWRSRFAAGATDYSSTGNWGSFATNGAAAASSVNPIVGYVARFRGKVVSVAIFGDSNAEGQTTLIGNNWVVRACTLLTQQTGVIYLPSNLGWSGQNTASARIHVADAIAQGLIPDLALIPAGSPNDISTTITDALLNGDGQGAAGIRHQVSSMETALDAAGVPLGIYTWGPSNTAIKNYGATDSLRRDYNDDIRARAQAGTPVFDIDRYMAGATVGGQVQINPDYESEGSAAIHWDEAGHERLKVPGAAFIKALAPANPGFVG